MEGVKLCFPQCRDFKCTKKALRYQGRTAWCQWTDEPCEPKRCNYAMCNKRQLLDDGVCGLSIKRKTQENIEPEDTLRDEIKIKGKLMRKTGEKRIF